MSTSQLIAPNKRKRKWILPPLFCLIIIGLVARQNIYAQYRIEHLEHPYNTVGSETGAMMMGDTVLVYSQLPANQPSKRQFKLSTSVMQLQQARVARNGKLGKPRPNRWGINDPRDHTGNIAQDPISHDLYFTRCRPDDPQLNCVIYYVRKLRRGWDKPRPLKGPINLKGYTATHPTIAHLANGQTILYFSSNRPDGMGGMDLWYSIVENGTASECVNLGPRINSPYDEITPFYDTRNEVLYFSSDRPGGKGGYDIYSAIGSRNTWQKTETVCDCLNSEHNDLYFCITRYDSLSPMPLEGYLSSNRKDSYFLTDSTCCNDLYHWYFNPTPILDTLPPMPQPDPIVEQSPHFMFPLFLYFHNDEPDPQSHSTSTTTPYPECQQHYAALRQEYISHQQTHDDSTLMNIFFDTCVIGNYHRVESLFDYIESLLDDGKQVELTIAGFASPIYKSDYNQALSQRRIESFINMVRTWRGGLFDEAIERGQMRLRQEPHGAVAPSTSSRNSDPIYGLPAALARRIEILSCEVKE